MSQNTRSNITEPILFRLSVVNISEQGSTSPIVIVSVLIIRSSGR